MTPRNMTTKLLMMRSELLSCKDACRPSQMTLKVFLLPLRPLDCSTASTSMSACCHSTVDRHHKQSRRRPISLE